MAPRRWLCERTSVASQGHRRGSMTSSSLCCCDAWQTWMRMALMLPNQPHLLFLDPGLGKDERPYCTCVGVYRV